MGPIIFYTFIFPFSFLLHYQSLDGGLVVLRG